MLTLTKSNAQYVLEKLNARKTADPDPVLDRLISERKMLLNFRDNPAVQDGEKDVHTPKKDLILKITARGFGIERELIQQMFEEGRLSWERARELRGNIALLEAQLQTE